MNESENSTTYRRTARTRLGRRRDRAHYDVETVHAVLDAGLICHIGYQIGSTPFVTPTTYWREGDRVYWHGAAAGRMLKHQREGVPVCFTVTHIDGIVLARSAFHHSMNYRSVMAFGNSELVSDPVEKRRQLELFMERVVPGRWAAVRPPSARELRVTSVMSLRLDEVVLKSRSGPPSDDPADLAVDVWAGTVPVTTRVGEPIDDPLLETGAHAPVRVDRLQVN